MLSTTGGILVKPGRRNSPGGPEVTGTMLVRRLRFHGRRFMKTAAAIAIALILAGCATATTSAPPGAQTFVGEVRNWNTKDNTVTLFQGSPNLVTVKVTPDQLVGLDLNRTARVQGVRVEPGDLNVLVPGGPMTTVPKGIAEVLELQGIVTTVDPAGRLTVNTTQGPIRIITAAGAAQRLHASSPVMV